MDTYKIIRFRYAGYAREVETQRVIKTGLTLEQAQEWCKREDTHGDCWFDGYSAETKV